MLLNILVFKTNTLNHSIIYPSFLKKEQAKRALNPRPLVLETNVLPTELFAFKKSGFFG